MKTTTRLVAGAIGAALAVAPSIAQAQYTAIVYNLSSMRPPNAFDDYVVGDKSVKRNTKVTVRHNEDGSVTYTYRTVPPPVKLGTVVTSLPTACTSVAPNGVLYERCGNTWYQPRLSGARTSYVVVRPPK